MAENSGTRPMMTLSGGGEWEEINESGTGSGTRRPSGVMSLLSNESTGHLEKEDKESFRVINSTSRAVESTSKTFLCGSRRIAIENAREGAEGPVPSNIDADADDETIERRAGRSSSLASSLASQPTPGGN